jgi:hypothetical protein
MFFAYHCDEFLVCAHDLARVLEILADLQSPDQPEDAAVWLGGRLVVVRHPDGRLVWIDPSHRPAVEQAA